MKSSVKIAVGFSAIFASSFLVGAEPTKEIRWYTSVFPFGHEREKVGKHCTWKQSDDKSIPEASVAELFFDELWPADPKHGYMKCAEKFIVPPMSKGDVFPYEGKLYAMDADSGETFYLKELFLREYPEGVVPVDKFSFIVPHEYGHGEGCQFTNRSDDRGDIPAMFRGKVWGLLQTTRLATEILGEKTREAAYLRYKGGDGKELVIQTATVRAGDILVMPPPVDAGLIVLNVVPKDKKSKTIGWVELSPKYIPLDEIDKKAKAEKRTVVRFEKPPKK